VIRECWECGAETEEIHDHHVIPRSRGGTKTVPICGACHAKAHHRNRNMTTSALVKECIARRRAADPSLKWGNPNIATTAQPLGVKVRKKNASDFNARIQAICEDLGKAGYCNRRQMAVQLNSLGLTTRRGRPFTKENLKRVLSYEVEANIMENEDKS